MRRLGNLNGLTNRVNDRVTAPRESGSILARNNGQ